MQMRRPPANRVRTGSLQAALRSDRDVAQPKKAKDEESGTSGTVRTVLLLPMSNRQIRLYAERSDVHDADALLTEIDRQNAWTFARRPLDLAELIAIWTSSERLGTRAEQHEANVNTKLMDGPDRPDRNVLSDAQAGWRRASRASHGSHTHPHTSIA